MVVMRETRANTNATEGSTIMNATQTYAEDLMTEAIRDNLSPHAVAAIASYVQAFSTGDDVNRETNWFAEQLIQMLGKDEWNRLCEELGL